MASYLEELDKEIDLLLAERQQEEDSHLERMKTKAKNLPGLGERIAKEVISKLSNG